jgi:antitoxin (DNA-binding transcriptional repressor) of toxin-antitoxin stability system
MQTIQESEAEANFSQVLEQVRQGETVLIARGEQLVARVTPEVEIDREKVLAAMAGIRELRKRVKPSTIEEILSARDEGRR